MTTLVNVETNNVADPGLNDLERKRLAHEETAIEAGASQIGKALSVIRDQRLYRESHPTFEAYCLARWGIGRNYANKQIAVVEVTAALGTNGTQLNERQARELAPLLDSPQVLQLVWAEAVKESDGKPTAALIAEVRERFIADLQDEVDDEIERQGGTRPERATRRSPLPDAYLRQLVGLRQKAEALTRLTKDDRYTANRSIVTGRHGSTALNVLLNISATVAQLDPAILAENEEARQWWLTSLNEITEVLSDFGHTLKES